VGSAVKEKLREEEISSPHPLLLLSFWSMIKTEL
jgi:hypothetical protein